MMRTYSSDICDSGGCPAPAACHYLVYGQDFRFCAHHGHELNAVLADAIRLQVTAELPKTSPSDARQPAYLLRAEPHRYYL